MAETFKFELITPQRVLLSAEVVQVVVPGSEGEFTVLPLHAPLISTLRPGLVDVMLPGAHKRFLVKDGVAHIHEGALTILSQHTRDVSALAPAELAGVLAEAA